MADDDQIKEQTQEESEAEASRYWNEAVNAHEGGEKAQDPVSEPKSERLTPERDKEETPVQDEETKEDATEDPSDQDLEEADGQGEEDEGTEAQDDPWHDIPDERRKEFEEFKAKAEKFEHEARSNRGRLGALQREINELNRKLEEATKGKTEKEPPVDTGDTIFDFPEWKQVEEDYGDVVKPLKAAIGRLQEQMHSRLMDTDKVSQELRDAEYERKLQKEALKLEESWPNWRAFVDDNREEFDSFVEADKAAKKLFAPNAVNLTDSDDAKALLTLFNVHLSTLNGNSSKPAVSELVQSKPNTQPRQLSEKRQKQLKSAATIAPRSHPAPGRRSDDLPEPDAYDDAERFFLQKATTR